jgi:branched-chain amino acid transport system ATP-binding protein
VLLLDEVMAGLTPTEARQTIATIRQIREHGVTVVLIDHVMSSVRDLADRVAVLNFGSKIAEGSFEAVARDRQVVEAYLGEEAGDGS